MRDASLEKPLSEDTAWVGRIFDVNRLRVSLLMDALLFVMLRPVLAIVALFDEVEFAWFVSTGLRLVA